MTDDISKKTNRSLKYSIYDGAAFSVMDGATSSFITPFAVALNSSVNLIAALTYVPQIAGASIQLFSARLVDILKDRRMMLVFGSLFHAILWIPLLLIPYMNPGQKYLLVVYISIQAMISQLINPVWNSLMGEIVPKNNRGKFFGLRNRVAGAMSFFAALFAGFILHVFSAKDPFLGFAILFAVAFIARVLSAVFKLAMYSPKSEIPHEEKFSILDFFKRMNKTNYGHFVIYITLTKFAVYVAAPFFTVYMLKDLGFSYIQYAILVAAEMIASFIALGFYGRLIDERGTKFVLYLTGMLVPFIPVLWLFSSSLYYLVLVECFSGIVWAGFNLSSSNFIFDAVRPENRLRCISYYKFFEGVAIFAGALFGGFLVSALPAWVFISSIPIVFLISGILRLIVSLILLPTLKEARLIELKIGESFFNKYLTIRPNEGFVFEVIGKYRQLKEKVKPIQKILKSAKGRFISRKESEAYRSKLLGYIKKEVAPKKEEHEITDMHDIEHITEDIEKGNFKKK